MKTFPYRILLGILVALNTSLPAPTRAETVPARALALKTIAVADFTGADKELGRFIAETLLTDLARSEKLTLVERNEISKALQEMKLQSTGLTEPSQVKKLGKLLSADGLIVGSYLQRDNRLMINARLLDVKTGKLAPGGATNISGGKNDTLPLVDRLANQLHKSLTGQPLPADKHESEESKDTETIASRGNTDLDIEDPSVAFLESLKAQNAAPENAKLNSVITERELDRLIRWQTLQFPRQDLTPLTLSKPNAPISRIRALAAIIKVALPSDHIDRFRGVRDADLTPDSKTMPTWGRAYLASAIEENWWSPQTRIQANQAATWAFAVALLSRMPVEAEREPAPIAKPAARYPEKGAITGIIIDATDLPLERSMSPRILDEDGNVVYPLPNTANDYDKLLDKGLMDYCSSEAQAQKRAGRNFLLVKGLDVIAPANNDVIISREDAERIREANKRGRFLQRWAVSVITRK